MSINNSNNENEELTRSMYDDGGFIYTQYNSTFLSITTFACCTLGITFSTVALTLLILTAILFKQWRKNYKNQLLLQLMVVRYVYTVLRYGVDIWMLYRGLKYFYYIQIECIFMMYTEVLLVAWMFVFSKQMYDSFVTVFNNEVTPPWKISLITWITPAVITAVLFLCSSENGLNIKLCLLYLFLIKWPTLFANGIFLFLVLNSIKNNKKIANMKNKRIIIVMITLVFTFCFQQALCDVYKLVNSLLNLESKEKSMFLLIINIFTIYHCAFSILFWLFGNQSTRILWGLEKPKSELNLRGAGRRISVSRSSSEM